MGAQEHPQLSASCSCSSYRPFVLLRAHIHQQLSHLRVQCQTHKQRPQRRLVSSVGRGADFTMVEEQYFLFTTNIFPSIKAQRKTRINNDKTKARARLEIAPKTIGTLTPSFMRKIAGRDMQNYILESRHMPSAVLYLLTRVWTRRRVVIN